MVLFIHLGVILFFLVSQLLAQNTSDFLALLNLDDQNITCITASSQKAITINYPLSLKSYLTEDKINQLNFNIKTLIFEIKTNLRNNELEPAMIFDERWNDFTDTKNRYRLRSDNPSIPLSIRGTGKIEIIFINNITNHLDKVAKLTIWEYRSEIRFYKYDNVTLNIKSIYLTSNKWTTFMLKFYYTKKKISVSYTLENGKEKFFEGEDLPYNQYTQVSEVLISNSPTALVRPHEFEYYYTTNETNHTMEIESSNDQTCFTIYAAICSSCSLSINHGNDVKKIMNKKHGTLWQMDTVCIENSRNNFKIIVQTWATNTRNKLFWAISLKSISAYKSFSVKYKYKDNAKDMFKTVYPQIKCQVIGEQKEIQFNASETDPGNVEECPSPVTFGPNCSMSCEMLKYKTCFGTRLFTSTSWVCPAGYVGPYCQTECGKSENTTFHFGQNCKHKCAKCAKTTCNNINGSCGYDGCLEGYEGEKCDTYSYPTLYNKPDLIVMNYTSIKVRVINNTYFGSRKPQKYQIEYRERNDIGPWKKYETYLNMEYNKNRKFIMILNDLKAGSTYDVRALLLTTEGHFSNSTPFATATTKCEHITKDNIKYTTEEFVDNAYTKIFIHFDLKKDNCPLKWYKFTCNTKCYDAINKTTVYINNSELRHYESYPVRVETRNDQEIFTYKYETQPSEPTQVRNISPSNETNSTITLSWLEPGYPNGQLHYVIEYNAFKHNFCKIDIYNDTKPSLSLNTSTKSITLKNLQPFTQYQIHVYAVNHKNQRSPPQYVWANTTESVELDEIIHGKINVSDITETSVKVNIWYTLSSCEKINGRICYEITCKGMSIWNTETFINRTGELTFNDIKNGRLEKKEYLQHLTAYSNYSVNAILFRCKNRKKSIITCENFKTAPSDSKAVSSAEKYAVDQNAIYVRWKPPYPPSGIIQKYILKFNYDEKNKKSIYVVKNIEPPASCDLWEDYICYHYENKKNLKYTEIATKNEPNKCSSSYTTFVDVTGRKPSEPRNVRPRINNDNEFEITWLHPLYLDSSLLESFIIKLGDEILNSSIYEPKKNYTFKYKNWFNYCGKSFNISICPIMKNTKYVQNAIVKFTFPMCKDLMKRISGKLQDFIQFLNKSLIIKLPTENFTRDSRNLVILAGTKNADIIPHFKFDNCSSFVKKLNEIFILTTTPIVSVENAERCWNITLTGNDLKVWKIYDMNNYTIKESSLNVDLFILNSFEPSFHYIIEDANLIEDIAKNQDKSTNWVWSLFIIVMIVVLIAIIWYRKTISKKVIEFLRNAFKLSSPFRDNQSDDSQMIPLTQSLKTLSLPRNAQHIKKFLDVNSIIENPISVTNFKRYVKEALETGELERQHQLFIRGQTKSWSYGIRPENKNKNRYINLIAYDETRVILQKIGNDPFSDYINANYIDGYKHKRAYIATQGPKAKTINDFWRMIWQERSKYIIMLANLVESDKKKCEQYWPDITQESVYGDIRVFQEHCTVCADYTCRKFKVTLNNESRQIEQYHFVSWPDHGVPIYAKSLLPLTRKLLSIPYETPIVVHCSAGVGRTGTIILCDIIFRMANNEQQVDVLYYLKRIRDQRPNLVDNIDQYILVHLVILESLSCQETNIFCEDLERKYINLFQGNFIPKQMAQIDDCIWMDRAMIKPSQPLTFNNKTKQKNRFSNIIPKYTNDLIYLSPNGNEEDSEYINAVFVDGYRCNDKFIVTQQPLPNTLGDFWRLVMEQDIKFIVSLNKFNPNDKTVADICPPANCELNPIPQLRIKYIKKTICSFYSLIVVQISYNPQIMSASQEDSFVQIIQLNKWSVLEPLPKFNKRDFIQFWQDVNKICEGNTTLITCYDGSLASGLFTALSFIIEQINFEHACDIPLAVRIIRRNRPSFIRSEEQFNYLYEIAIAYVQSFSTYSNFE